MAVASDPWTISGGGTGNIAPPGLCIVLNLKPTRGTGRGQGRKYLGPLDAGVIQGNGTVGESWRNLVRNTANDQLLLPGPTNGAFVLYTPARGIARDVVSVSVPNKFGMLRSRRD